MEEVSGQVTEKVAQATNREVLELPPLYDVIDPDALETVIESMSDGEVSFVYTDYEVVVDSDGAIELSEPCPNPLP